MENKFKVGDKVNLVDTRGLQFGPHSAYPAGFKAPGVVYRVGGDFIDVEDARGEKYRGVMARRFEKIDEPKRLKVGQKVRITGDDRGHPVGTIGTIKTVAADSTYFVEARGVGWWASEGHVEAVEETPIATKHWFICVLEGNDPQPASTPRLYKSAEQARAVAFKMAEKSPGDRFVVYEATDVVVAEVPAKPVVSSRAL